jgi:hypothetical protein
VIDGQSPLSPEHAAAVLPDFGWQPRAVQPRARADAQQERLRTLLAHEARGSIREAAMLVPWGLVAFVFVTLVTLAFTLLANATR